MANHCCSHIKQIMTDVCIKQIVTDAIIKHIMTDVYFNPIQDLNDNWVISSEEIDQSEDKEIISFKYLRLNYI